MNVISEVSQVEVVRASEEFKKTVNSGNISNAISKWKSFKVLVITVSIATSAVRLLTQTEVCFIGDSCL